MGPTWDPETLKKKQFWNQRVEGGGGRDVFMDRLFNEKNCQLLCKNKHRPTARPLTAGPPVPHTPSPRGVVGGSPPPPFGALSTRRGFGGLRSRADGATATAVRSAWRPHEEAFLDGPGTPVLDPPPHTHPPSLHRLSYPPGGSLTSVWSPDVPDPSLLLLLSRPVLAPPPPPPPAPGAH